MTVTVFIGLQYGDEGKGKIIDSLCRDYDIVGRYNGGDNAGHTVVKDGKRIALHLIPSGILERKICVIGNGVNINLESLIREIKEIKERFGFDPLPYLYISDRTHIILPEDVTKSKSDGNSTGKGIGPSYARKYSRKGIRLADLFDISDCHLEERFRDVDGLDKIVELAQQFRNNTYSVSRFLNNAIQSEKNILLEGSQGSGLDIDHGQYPYVTSSSSVAGGASTGLGIGPTKINRVIGVAKVYTTRVDGNQESPFPTQLDGNIEQFLRDCGKEYGATTGRPRRCGWFDVVQVNDAILTSGVDEVILTKLDILDNLSCINVCVAYNINGKVIEEYPSTAYKLRQIVPIYKILEGWKGKTTKRITDFKDLPDNAKNYIDFLKGMLKAKVKLISNGEEANELIKVG